LAILPRACPRSRPTQSDHGHREEAPEVFVGLDRQEPVEQPREADEPRITAITKNKPAAAPTIAPRSSSATFSESLRLGELDLFVDELGGAF
jgi:hypothetical protein